jgi:hypothetical protein
VNKNAPDILHGSRGRILFFILLTLIGSLAIFAFQGAGPMGVEERFSSALGISQGQETHADESASGFSLEGHPLFYGILLVLLVMMCWVVYRKFGI